MIYALILLEIQNTFWKNFGYNILASVSATIIFLSIYEFLWKNVISYHRNKKYCGRYYHYSTEGKAFKDEIGNHNYCDISINFLRRDILIVSSYLFDHTSKKWNGEIKIDSSKFMNGMGTYCYEDESEMGNHRIYSVDEKTIFVQILDIKSVGYANLWIKSEVKHL